MLKLSKRLFPCITTSPNEKNRLSRLNLQIDRLFLQNLVDEANSLKKDSARRLTFLFGPWICNFKCPDYCYTKGAKTGILTTKQTIEIIDQARKMGVQTTYWPGEGELTLLKSFWNIMGYQNSISMPAVLFTNGSIFADNYLCKKTLGITPDELQNLLKTKFHNIHFYVKYWSSSQEKAANMVGVSSGEYPYTSYEGRDIPSALAWLLEAIPKDRIGVEVMVSSENYEDVTENILPTIEELQIHGFVEPVIFSGNAEAKQLQFGLNSKQYNYLSDIFTSGGNYCEKRQSTELIVRGTRLTPGIAIPPRDQDMVIGSERKILDLFQIFHNDYFRRMRLFSEKLNGCLCRAFWNGKINDPTKNPQIL